MLTPSGADYVLWIHVIAATVWIGGQITIGMLMPALTGYPDLVIASARRFGVIAWSAFAVLIVTGLINMHDAGISFSDLSHTGPGQTLGIKLVLVALSGVAAGAHSVLASRGVRSRQLSGILGALSLLPAIAAAFFGVVIAQS